MSARPFAGHVVVAIALVLLGGAAAGGERPPNVVLLLADDLGYADVGFTGGVDIPTPSIDRIAAEGARFPQGYVTCPVCSPTRAGLVTGRYQQRFGHEFNTGGLRDDWAGIGLPVTESTLADRLRAVGYVTGAIGKWHLGRDPKFHPNARGFAEWYGFLSGARSYWNDARGKRSPILRDREAVEENEYLTDAFGREAEAFVARHRERPFLLYVAFNAVHTPMHAKPQDVERFARIPDRKRRTYAGMLHAMDAAVGRILAALEKHGLEENTIVAFLSDNGGPERSNGSDNGPLRAGKGTVYEGGVRVPFAIRWPARIKPRTVYAWPVISLDVTATAAAAGGATWPEERPIDGVDLLPFLRGEREGGPHESLFWRFSPQLAVRHGDLKLVKRGETVELFDLAADPGETTDLAAERPEAVRELMAVYERWEKGTVEPAWPRPKRRRRK
jgi:arylsulfatase A-like enzyme